MSTFKAVDQHSGSLSGSLTTGRILKAGLISIVAAAFANLGARLVLVPLASQNTGFPPFGLPQIILFTIIGTFLGVLVFLAIRRISKNPIRTYTIVAIIALAVSILPNLAAMANPSVMAFPFGDPGTSLDFGLLIVFHVIAAFVHLGVFISMLRR